MDPQLRSHQQPFFAAVRSGDLDSLRRILDEPDGVRAGADEAEGAAAVAALMAARNEHGQTGHHVAAEGNQEEVLRYLVGLCDFDTAAIRSNVGITAFHTAAKCGNTSEGLGFLYWVSQGNKWCDFCKIYIANNPLNIRTHELGKRHKDNVAARLASMRKECAAKEKEKKEAAKALEQIEVKAQRSYQKDLAAFKEAKTSGQHASETFQKDSNGSQFSVDSKEWQFDTASGYYYNSANGHYYDPNSSMYFLKNLDKSSGIVKRAKQRSTDTGAFVSLTSSLVERKCA